MVSLMEDMITLRDNAVERGNVSEALERDNILEEFGMHADERRTCWSCKDIVTSDHAH